MAEWKYACKTTQGMDLDLKLLSRGMALKLTKSRSGAGRTSPTQLMLLQDVMDPVQELRILDAVERLEEDVIRIPVVLKNRGVKEGYDMHQLGIYAEDPDAGEILYIVLQSDSAEEIPSAEEMKDFTLEWYLNLSVGNAQEVTVMIDETDVLTTEEADAKYVAKDAASDTEVTFEESTDRDDISSGDTLSTLFGKIKKWFADLKTVSFTGSYNDLSDKPTIPAAVRVKGDAETTYHTGDVNVTPANIGLGDVGNFKAVSTASQTLSETEKSNARANIGAAPTSHASTATTHGTSSATNYGHAMASSTTPKANGTATAGTETAKFARGDHVHPLQTSVTGSSGSCTGNAVSATKATQDGNGNNIVSTYLTKTGKAASAATADSATKATQDGNGNNIADTYLAKAGGMMTGSIITPQNDSMGIIPATSNYGQIGSSDKRFYRMYATTFYGDLSGNATSATKATKDGSGNVIADTYWNKSKDLIITKTLALNQVTLSGNCDGYTNGQIATLGDYKAVFAVPRTSNASDVTWMSCYLDGTTVRAGLKNTSSGSKTFTPDVTVVYLRTS